MRNSLKVITEKQSIAMQFYCQITELIFFPLAWAKHTREQAKKKKNLNKTRKKFHPSGSCNVFEIDFLILKVHLIYFYICLI